MKIALTVVIMLVVFFFGKTLNDVTSVSYTHLDVYKRQEIVEITIFSNVFSPVKEN